jgi:transposase-like protein
MRRFNRVLNGSFPLFLQEVVWRFNARTPENQLRTLRKLLRRE